METIGFLLDGIFTSLQWFNLALLIFGCLIGLCVGAMPGLGSVNGVAILIPITFIIPPTAVGGIINVIGIKIATPFTEPRPGIAPTHRPIKHPNISSAKLNH